MNLLKERKYVIIWIEGLDYFYGEKIKSISKDGIMYTTKMTEALRVKLKDIPYIKQYLLDYGIAKWALNDNSFIKTSYAKKGTIFNIKNLVC